MERKAAELVVLDLRGISSATDFFLLGSGSSDTQVRSIADHIIEELRKEGVRPGHVEGIEGGHWVLIDYIDFVVHVFHPQARSFYHSRVCGATRRAGTSRTRRRALPADCTEPYNRINFDEAGLLHQHF
jgi:ribosome-associated protein